MLRAETSDTRERREIAKKRPVAPGNGGSPLGRMHRLSPSLIFSFTRRESSSSLSPCNAPIRSIPHLPVFAFGFALRNMSEPASPQRNSVDAETRVAGNPRNDGSAGRTNFPSEDVPWVSDDSRVRMKARLGKPSAVHSIVAS